MVGMDHAARDAARDSATPDLDAVQGPGPPHSTCVREQPHRLSMLLFCLRAIPFCGGWCDVHENPEKTVFVTFSNEKSVTRLCLVPSCRAWCEYSTFCRASGAIGFPMAQRFRRRIMCTAFTFTFIGWVCMLLSALGGSNDARILTWFSWAPFRTNIEMPDGTIVPNAGIETYVGVNSRMVYLTGMTVVNQSVVPMPGRRPLNLEPIPWDDGACSEGLLGTGKLDSTMEVACSACYASRERTMSFIISSCLTQIFQLLTDLQRLTRYGDLNCQKNMGVVTSATGLISGLSSLASFHAGCIASLPSNTVYYATSSTLARGLGASHITMVITKRVGLGMLLMALGTVLKLVDVILHLLLPTPEPKRQRFTGTLSLVEYMRRGVASRDKEDAESAQQPGLQVEVSSV